MTREQFDDNALISVATKYYKAGCYDENVVRVLNQASDKLDTIERNILLRYVQRYQDVMFNNIRTGMSMRQMRDALLKKCGREDLIPTNNSSYYGQPGNVSAAQLRAIYNHVMGIEELKEDQ